MIAFTTRHPVTLDRSWHALSWSRPDKKESHDSMREDQQRATWKEEWPCACYVWAGCCRHRPGRAVQLVGKQCAVQVL